MIERKLQLDSDIKNLDTINSILEEIYELEEVPFPTQFQVSVAVEELFSNICNYAYLEGNGSVGIELKVYDSTIRVLFSDHGIPFNPLEKEDPNTKASAEERQIGGLGIFMVKKSMDEFNYNYRDNQNIVEVVKKFNG